MPITSSIKEVPGLVNIPVGLPGILLAKILSYNWSKRECGIQSAKIEDLSSD